MATTPDSPAEGDSLSKDDIFEVFSNERRRIVFDYLKRRDGEAPVDTSDLSTRVTATELDMPSGQIAYDDRKNVHTTLYQFHLPKMDDAGIVEFDQQSGTVQLTEAGEELDIYLEAVSEDEVPWAVYFVLLSGTMLLVVAARWLDAYPVTVFDGVEWAAIVSVTHFVSSMVYLYNSRYKMRIGADEPPFLR